MFYLLFRINEINTVRRGREGMRSTCNESKREERRNEKGGIREGGEK